MIEVPFSYGGIARWMSPGNCDMLQQMSNVDYAQATPVDVPQVYQPPAASTYWACRYYLSSKSIKAKTLILVPTERIADTLETFFGIDASGLRGLVPTDPNYRSANTLWRTFQGAFNILGYAPGYIPRALRSNSE